MKGIWGPLYRRERARARTYLNGLILLILRGGGMMGGREGEAAAEGRARKERRGGEEVGERERGERRRGREEGGAIKGRTSRA